jgi:hypothetical protein
MKTLIKRFLFKIYVRIRLFKEKSHQLGDNHIKYLFDCVTGSNALLVIFSGFPAKGKKPNYNLLTKINHLKINKLFILDDFGADYRGSYYLGKNGVFLLNNLSLI